MRFKSKQIYRLFVLAACGSLFPFFQNCGGFQSATSVSRTSASADGGPTLEEIAGEKLYGESCAACHKPIVETQIPGRSPNQISIALQTVTDMSFLSKLDSESIKAISKALGYTEPKNVIAVCDTLTDLPTGQLFRLTKTQYALMLESLFGVPKGIDYLADWPKEYVVGSFDNNGLSLDVNEILLTALMALNEKVIDDVWANAALRTKVLSCSLSTAGCVSTELSRFLERAFRRQPDKSEIDRYIALFNKLVLGGESQADAYKTVLQTALVSPAFLFNSYVRGSTRSDGRKQLTDTELANRISFMIWGVGPDEQLLNASAMGAFRSKSGIQQQIARMLKDARAKYFISSFFTTWLIPNSNSVQVSAFTKLTDQALKDAMAKETELFIDDLVKRDAPLSDLISGKYSFVNAKLASHYKISGNFTTSFQRVDLQGAAGILSQGRVLAMVGRDAAEINPILRGKWFMDKLLCESPPPPANLEQVNSILESQLKEGLTSRQMAQFRNSTAICASCHSVMDNYGFTFEGFDSLGRHVDGLVDNVGVMPDGKTVSGVGDLSQWLATRNNQKACFAKQMGAFVYGRPLAKPDECVANKVGLDNWDQPLSSWLTQFVQSDGFQQVR